MIVNSVNYISSDYIPITTYQELIDAFATSNDKPLRLMNDLTATAKITTNKTNTLDLNGHTITGDNTFGFMSVITGGNTTLDDSVGGGTITTFKTTSYGGGIYVGGGTFTMKGGNITNCTTTDSGGGVGIGDGTFNMNGGSITNCNATSQGGGVYIRSSTCKVNMNGGTIKDCNATSQGGGIYVGYVGGGGTFTMNEGAIANCNATGSSASGGGVYLYSGKFIMNGGSITGCTAKTNGGCAYIYSGTFKMSGGSISECTAGGSGGGIYSFFGTFDMSGGSITGCTATNSTGGVCGGTFKIGGTAIIQNNMEGTTISNVYSSKISLASNFYGNIGITYPTPSAGGTIGTATAGVTGAENIHADTTRTLIGLVDGTTLKWQTAT